MDVVFQSIGLVVLKMTTDFISLPEVLQRVNERFSIKIPSTLSLKFVHIPKKRDPSTFKRLTLVAESIDTIKLAWNSLNQFTPDIFVDTTGCAFTFLVAKLALCKVVAYVHYPTVSTDMLQLVWERRPTYNNSSTLTKSSLATYIKLVYYSIFAIVYGLVGSLSDLAMVNSTWTYNHIHFLWRFARKRLHIVYPPCDVQSLQSFQIDNRQNMILSIGQFRPEKDHPLQIRSFARLRKRVQDHPKLHDVRLILVGSCRGESDENRVEELKKLAQSLGISKHVEFVLNQPFPVLKEYFSKASVGLHTMWNEHFGIGVVEMQAAGLLTIAHNSGGPKSDIIRPNKTGFLASTEEEYANAMYTACIDGLDNEKCKQLRSSGRQSSTRFSDEVFNVSFKKLLLESKCI